MLAPSKLPKGERLSLAGNKENGIMRLIKEGDIVFVNFNNAQVTLTERAEVVNIPQATGDSWYFKDCLSGEVNAVSEGCTITLLKAGDK